MKIFLAFFVLAGSALAEVGVSVHVGIPAPVIVVEEPEVVFEEAPPVVMASPGVYVVPNYRTEVFFVSGFYWTRSHGNWYRCAGPRHKWVRAKHAPRSIHSIPHGKYRNWNPPKYGHHHGYHEGHGKKHHKH